MDRTSLEIVIGILGVLILRGIYILLRRNSNPEKGKGDGVEENIRPTEEVVFLLSIILLAVCIALWFQEV